MADESWDNYKAIVADHIEKREKYQKTLGQVAATVVETYGSNSLDGFAHEISENYGVKIAPSSLRNYAWVYNKTSELDLPEDITFQVYQLLASMKKKEEYAHKIVHEGLSSTEAVRMLKKAKGVKKKPKFICKSCGAEN